MTKPINCAHRRRSHRRHQRGPVSAKVNKRSHFMQERYEFAPGLWFPSFTQYDFDGRKFLANFSFHERMFYSKYRRIGPPKKPSKPSARNSPRKTRLMTSRAIPRCTPRRLHERKRYTLLTPVKPSRKPCFCATGGSMPRTISSDFALLSALIISGTVLCAVVPASGQTNLRPLALPQQQPPPRRTRPDPPLLPLCRPTHPAPPSPRNLREFGPTRTWPMPPAPSR